MSKVKRVGVGENGDGGIIGVDDLVLVFVISNGEDLVLFIWVVFEIGKFEMLVY